jgi:hypothetical protein
MLTGENIRLFWCLLIRPILRYAGLLESFFSQKILFHSHLLSLSTIDQEAEVSRMVWDAGQDLCWRALTAPSFPRNTADLQTPLSSSFLVDRTLISAIVMISVLRNRCKMLRSHDF